MIKNIRHSGIVVKDLKKALYFYRDLLGMNVIIKKKEKGRYIETLFNQIGFELTYVKLETEDKSSLLELYWFHNITSSELPSFFTHIAYTVDNIYAILRMLEKNNIYPVSKPILDPKKKNLVMFCRDYDGNLIEFVEEIKK